MSITATILLIISAATHAGWNFISKKEHPTQAFYLVANTIGVICVLPVLLYYRHQVHLIPALVWIFAVISGFFLAAYLQALAGAYRSGDISVAYPLARAMPVIFVIIITLLLGKGQPLNRWFILGAILVVGGCIVLPMKAFNQFHLSNYKNLCCLLAVLAAVGISGYTIIDDMALRHLRELPKKPFNAVDGTLIYMVLEGIFCSLWQSLFVVFDSCERRSFTEVVHDYRGAAAITGIGIYLTYGLVLISMNYVTNVSYVATFRQLSIPLSALFGMALLNEPRYNPKIIAVTMIFVGLVMVGFG
jgi:drug/metabolite transporter (DMT)-like permease